MLTETLARRALSEHTFATFDGTRLYYRAWLPPRARALACAAASPPKDGYP